MVGDAATAQLRAIVQRDITAGRQVLIVPLLISFGGIERGLRERLDGLTYTMAEAALMPDDPPGDVGLDSFRGTLTPPDRIQMKGIHMRLVGGAK